MDWLNDKDSEKATTGCKRDDHNRGNDDYHQAHYHGRYARITDPLGNEKEA
jgi:hypothetical protein